MQPFTICTAGHIDHGKTALVKALTGTDTDRLKEEKARGITIELGYAFLNENIAFVDVPGHERFIKNMAAGAAVVDFALLVVAADDGVMPQTREHLDILKLLGVSDGVTAITKCDLADDEWLDLVEADIRETVRGSFLDGREVVRVDSLSGRGVETLRGALYGLEAKKTRDDTPGMFRMPVDRVFSVKGFGTVVTGSVLTGSASVEDKLTLLPQGTEVRVRGIESQGKRVDRAVGGMRAALNLAPVSVEDVRRGDVLATPGRLSPTFMLDTSLTMLPTAPVSLGQRDRVRVHIGCSEIMARVVLLDADEIRPGESALVQLRLESMTAAARTDRFVIRRYSPQITIGGGQVLDANPRKFRMRDRERAVASLQRLGASKSEELIEGLLTKAGQLSWEELMVQAALTPAELEDTVGTLSVAGRLLEIETKGKRLLISGALRDRFEARADAFLTEFHRKNPLKPGAKKGEILQAAAKGISDVVSALFWDSLTERGKLVSRGGDIFALEGFEVRLSAKEEALAAQLSAALERGGFSPPDLTGAAELVGMSERAARSLLQHLIDRGEVVGTDGRVFFHVSAVEEGRVRLRDAFAETPSLSMSEFRQLMDTSRKYALPLLNYYDNRGVTMRRDDRRLPGPKLQR